MIPLVDNAGRVYVAPSGVPVTWNAGVGYDNTGRMCVSNTLSPTDVYLNGWRLDQDGRVVVAGQNLALVSNGGLPFNNVGTPGAMARQVDVAPAVNDPYVGGIRVGTLGGVYFTSASPPSDLTGFDDGFSQGYGA